MISTSLPRPIALLPGRGTVHQGFQIVYEAVRENLRKLVQLKAPGCKELLITATALAAPSRRCPRLIY